MTTTTTAANPNPLKGLLAYGQSAWMDYIRRDLLISGELQRIIHDDGLRGMTSNPAIFEKAIATGKDYADILSSPEAKKMDAKGIYEKIAIRDVQDATDIFKPEAAATAAHALQRMSTPRREPISGEFSVWRSSPT